MQCPGEQPPRHLGLTKTHVPTCTPDLLNGEFCGWSSATGISLRSLGDATTQLRASVPDQGSAGFFQKGQIVNSLSFAGCDLCRDPSTLSRRWKSSKRQKHRRGWPCSCKPVHRDRHLVPGGVRRSPLWHHAGKGTSGHWSGAASTYRRVCA